jgi:hypothetical protein
MAPVGLLGILAIWSRFGCAKPDHQSLGYASGIAISRDGESAYLAADAGITRFHRRANGRLVYASCLVATAQRQGCPGPFHRSVGSASDVAVSPNGRKVYVGNYDGEVSALKRSPGAGLEYLSCVGRRTDGCKAPPHKSLRGIVQLALSSKTEALYAVADAADALTRFAISDSVAAGGAGVYLGDEDNGLWTDRIAR